MAHKKNRNQCCVLIDGKFVKAKSHHVGQIVYDKKTHKRLGVLLEPNPNTSMLRMLLDSEGEQNEVVTLK